MTSRAEALSRLGGKTVECGSCSSRLMVDDAVYVRLLRQLGMREDLPVRRKYIYYFACTSECALHLASMPVVGDTCCPAGQKDIAAQGYTWTDDAPEEP